MTTNNLVMVVALFIAAGWAWGSVGVLERNYTLQRELDAKKRELTLIELQTDLLRFERQYYKSDEYKELAVRQRMGLAQPGEKALILPPNTVAAKQTNEDQGSAAQATQSVRANNMQQWIDFLFGGN